MQQKNVARFQPGDIFYFQDAFLRVDREARRPSCLLFAWRLGGRCLSDADPGFARPADFATRQRSANQHDHATGHH